MNKRYVSPFIRAEREYKIMTELLCLEWGHGIPICETTASMSREDAYEEYAYWCIKKLKEYGITVKTIQVAPYSDIGEMSQEVVEQRKQNADFVSEMDYLEYKLNF